MSASNRPHILFLSLSTTSMFEAEYGNLISKIGTKAIITRVFLPIPAIRILLRNFHAVFLTDEDVTAQKNILVCQAVVEYMQAGGTVICMGCFSKFLNALGASRFFEKANLHWRLANRHTAEVFKAKESLSRAERRKLPASYHTDAVYLREVNTNDSWYRTTEEDITSLDVVDAGHLGINPFTYPTVMGRVGLGKLGYVGDTRPSSEYETVVLVMAGLI